MTRNVEAMQRAAEQLGLLTRDMVRPYSRAVVREAEPDALQAWRIKVRQKLPRTELRDALIKLLFDATEQLVGLRKQMHEVAGRIYGTEDKADRKLLAWDDKQRDDSDRREFCVLLDKIRTQKGIIETCERHLADYA